MFARKRELKNTQEQMEILERRLTVTVMRLNALLDHLGLETDFTTPKPVSWYVVEKPKKGR